MAREAAVVEATLNGLRLSFDASAGSLVRMSYPGVGTMVETTAERGGLLDLAYPLKEFEPLRLGARYSQEARVEASPQGVTVTWDALGASRAIPFPGRVSAVVRLTAAPDGRSIIGRCEVHNRSDHPVRQVLFPDFDGFVPFAGEEGTEFRSAGFASKPFRQLKRSPNGIGFYAQDPSVAGVEYASGGYFGTTPMIARWMDLGSLKGGISLFRRAWSWGPDDPTTAGERVWLRLLQEDGRLRMACMHAVQIAPGQSWDSGEYWLTPHTGGWAKGIEPFGEWVRQNAVRPVPVAKHVREGLGFRTLWMSEQYVHDPAGKSIIWRFRDLEKLAAESKEHGLDEMMLWSWGPYQLPFWPPHPQLGTEEELAQAAARCKELGVNLNLFISLMSLMTPTAERYGLKPSEAGSWTYHRELVPVFRASYAPGAWTAWVDQTNREWQRDVLDSMKHGIEIGCPSFGWDQFAGVKAEPNLFTLSREYLLLARARDPEATFAGESVTHIEEDCRYLDYTWDWYYWPATGDCRPFVSVFPAPRLNVHVDSSPVHVKYGFMDNLYLGVWPSRTGGVNGSAMVADYPELSKALKTCAALRRQFLPYFVEGRLIGDCILTEACPRARVNGYVLPDRVLIIAINEGPAQALRLRYDLDPWAKPPSGKRVLRTYNEAGERLSTRALRAAAGEVRTRKLSTHELALLEYVPG